ncbi:MAG: hypothetical protein JOZ81_21340 [Chloroflexi bacterium]|nr:hypothetical protein [Chloroflexota bacterium]
MVDEGRSADAYGGTRPWEDRGGRAAGTILATAIAAGVVAYLLRRSREEQEQPASRMAHLAKSWAGSDNVEAGRDFLIERILPELKPALLSGLSELEDIVDQAFRRIEKNIKKL